jgi:tetratricopeptide (TPR) repeat protein
MPSTLNGIGTHYYGKKNHSFRTAACRSCNRVGNLESYDTRLWFVIIFIPIIPLGRKRILDACPACSRHYVVKADVYEENKQAQTAASLEQFRQQPSPDSALQTHGLLLAFHEPQQAADFRQTALPLFPHNASLRVTMAAQLREMLAFDDSVELYLQALKIDPKLPEARIGVALRRITEGNFEEAQRLLDFLMKPGAGRSYRLGSLDYLATSLQKAERHEEALNIADFLLREEPARADDYKFRSLVKRSEKALGKFESILPERGFSLGGLFSSASHHPPWVRKLVIGGGLTLLIGGGLIFSNDYIKQHRTLHVLNATGETAMVQVDDQPVVPVVGLGKLTVSEGTHVVKVTRALNETQQLFRSLVQQSGLGSEPRRRGGARRNHPPLCHQPGPQRAPDRDGRDVLHPAELRLYLHTRTQPVEGQEPQPGDHQERDQLDPGGRFQRLHGNDRQQPSGRDEVRREAAAAEPQPAGSAEVLHRPGG